MTTIKKVINNGNEYCIGGKEYSVATETSDGLMSAADKKKINKLSPSGYSIKYLVVGGGGGGGGPSYQYSTGGGGGAVCRGGITDVVTSYAITVGKGGTGMTKNNIGTDSGASCARGGDSCIVGGITCIIAKGGNGGMQYDGCMPGTSGSGISYNNYYYCGCGRAGGNGAFTTGRVPDGCNDRGGNSGRGYFGMGGGGAGYGCTFLGTTYDGGGAAGLNCGCNATNYGGGGGTGYNCCGGNGCQGVVDICYLSDGSSGITSATGGSKTLITAGGRSYCRHRFTSSGTFTIVS